MWSKRNKKSRHKRRKEDTGSCPEMNILHGYLKNFGGDPTPNESPPIVISYFLEIYSSQPVLVGSM